MRRAPRESERICGRTWSESDRYAPATCKHGGRIRCVQCGTGASDTPHTTRGGRGRVAQLQAKGAKQP